MLVMVSNQRNRTLYFIAGRYSALIGKPVIGHLYSPDGWGDVTKHPYLPYALDNGAYSAYLHGKAWDQSAYERMLDRPELLVHRPLWALAPDVVADREATLRQWDVWEPQIRERGFSVAFAAQDGMTVNDVPDSANLVFIGGSTDWKLRNIEPWSEHFLHLGIPVHVARVNTYSRLRRCYDCGIASVDGTGWWHDAQLRQLDYFFRQLAGIEEVQTRLIAT
jgi:hypothetical protein